MRPTQYARSITFVPVTPVGFTQPTCIKLAFLRRVEFAESAAPPLAGVPCDTACFFCLQEILDGGSKLNTIRTLQEKVAETAVPAVLFHPLAVGTVTSSHRS